MEKQLDLIVLELKEIKEILNASIKTIAIKDNDVILLSADRCLSQHAIEVIEKTFRETFEGKGIKNVTAVVVEKGIEIISVISKSE